MNPYLLPLGNTEGMRANAYKGCTPSDSVSDSDLWASGNCGNRWSKLKATPN
jgi:hypothetical protein